MSAAERIFALEPSAYRAHPLHAHDRDFRESNCYADVFIGVLHALGREPLACLGFTLASEFEGDQWTFFKPPHADLLRLYGVGVEELTLWRPLVEHVQVQLARRRLPLVEVDAYFLPDTAASDYRKNHVKTTIAIAAMDREARRLRYFHNAGFYELEGHDFDGLFRIGLETPADFLPPYCEIVKPDRGRPLAGEALRAAALELACHYFALRPAHNPVHAHAAQLQSDLEAIAAGGLPTYHAYSFAVMRQLGANFELASAFLRWLGGDASMREAADSFAQISRTAKMLILKLARLASAGRGGDLSASFEDMARAWDSGMARLAEGLDRR